MAGDSLPCGDISRAAGFRGAARFRGNTVLLLIRQNVPLTFHLANSDWFQSSTDQPDPSLNSFLWNVLWLAG